MPYPVEAPHDDHIVGRDGKDAIDEAGLQRRNLRP